VATLVVEISISFHHAFITTMVKLAALSGFPQMLTRNSLKMSSKFPKFHKNCLDFAQSSV